MIKYLYCVIDPKLDRPCFSSDPPPDTLKRTRGMRVFRYEYQVPDPTPTIQYHRVSTEAEARAHAFALYDSIKE